MPSERCIQFASVCAVKSVRREAGLETGAPARRRRRVQFADLCAAKSERREASAVEEIITRIKGYGTSAPGVGATNIRKMIRSKTRPMSWNLLPCSLTIR